MERAEPTGERGDRGPNAFGVHDSARFDAVREHTAGRELHDEVRASVVELADVVDRDDVGALHAAQQLRLANESLAGLGVVRVLRGQDLDGDVRVERLVEGRQDDAEPADAEDRTNPVPGDLLGDAVHRTPVRASEEVGDVAAVDDRRVDHVVIAVAGGDADRRRIATGSGRHRAFGDELGVVVGRHPLALLDSPVGRVVADLIGAVGVPVDVDVVLREVGREVRCPR